MDETFCIPYIYIHNDLYIYSTHWRDWSQIKDICGCLKMAAFICSFQPPSVLMAGFRSWAARRSPDQVTSQLPMEHSREFRAAESRVTNWSNCENLPSAVVVTCKHPESPLPGWTNRKQDCQIVKKKFWQIGGFFYNVYIDDALWPNESAIWHGLLTAHRNP